MDKCFCHLNGYKVKDADARKSIEELTTKVTENKTSFNEELKALTNIVIQNNNNTNTSIEESIFYVTPQMFGAKGDGVSDDSDAIQACFDSGCDVVIPKGTYNVSKTLLVNTTDFKPHITLQNCTLVATCALSPLLSIGTENTPVLGRVIVDGYGIINMNYNQDSIGILINDVSCIIRGVEIRKAGNNSVCIQNGVTKQSTGTIIEDCLLCGVGSDKHTIGLITNNLDCIYRSIKIAYCRIGIKHYGGSGDYFDGIHIWAHSYDNWNSDIFKTTYGIDMYGNFIGGKIYIDSVYRSIRTNGKNFITQHLVCGTDITYEDIPYHIIFNCNVYQHIKVDSLTLFGCKFMTSETSLTNITGKNLLNINYIDGTPCNYLYDIRDYANASSVSNTVRNNLTQYAITTEANKPYFIGYIGADDYVDISVTVKGHDVGKKYHIKNNVATVEKLGVTDYFNLYVGESETFLNGVYYPLYVVFPKAKSYMLLNISADVKGNADFYITDKDAIENLITADISTLTNLESEVGE